jgi:transposase-like protein
MFQWNWRSVMRRRIFGREFKIEAVKLICGRGVSVAQAD